MYEVCGQEPNSAAAGDQPVCLPKTKNPTTGLAFTASCSHLGSIVRRLNGSVLDLCKNRWDLFEVLQMHASLAAVI